MNHRWLAEAEARAVELANLLGFPADASEHLVDLAGIQIAQFKTQGHFSWDNVVGARLRLDPSHGADLPAGNAGDDLVHHLNESCARKQSVVPLIHGSGAGMIGKAFDCDFRMQNADDPLYDTDIHLLLLERSALFDVEFEISGNA